ncbi:type II secretion system F family protein [Paraburkholderia sp.]|uniref:type II secretion system F family protein n=1 Tax=Paraburkholderia sp. TaxID=1926495 RepID=UPI0023911CD6|nr:type II secretion system F family protein [Paraburkholderia sp.]MDE1184643.1 type II secretion system F family protein [Paraburkholderia sp.]
MSSAVVVIAALALLCAAGALLLLQRGAQRKGRASTERFIDSRMATAAAAVMPSAVGGAGAGGAAARGAQPQAGHAAKGASGTSAANTVNATNAANNGNAGNAEHLQARWRAFAARAQNAFDMASTRAGVKNARVAVAIAAALTFALCMWSARVGGWVAASVAAIACTCFLYFIVSWRMQKRRQKIVRQLPLFLDGIVRLIILGNSVPAAFQASLQTTEAPLRECLDHVSRMLRTGVEIDRALSQVAHVYGASELELIGAVLRLSVKYGGRADVMLDRMASFMRDLEQAERELVAMSSETRMSAWVLAMLPIGIGGFLALGNPKYFGAMWYDATGRNMVYLAFGLQVLGAYLLFRLARLK